VRLLIVNGDDFGLSAGVNEGIIEAHASGILTSTSLMVRAPAAEQAAHAARDHPELSVGLHFVEDDRADLDDPTHVDSHHHVHSERMATFSQLVRPLGVPLRGDGRVAYVGGFWAQWEPGVTELNYVSRSFLLELVNTEVLDGYTEIACHPARITGDFSSSYLDERAVELATLTEPGLREEIEAAGARLVSYRDWPTRAGSRS
jgi:predicted glycoside hydrolase/deacetylase ChbG (UPF0249 family)